MSQSSPQFRLDSRPLADPKAVVQTPHARFTVLTPQLIRLEYSPEGQFEDRASQAFWYRRQPVPPFETIQKGNSVEIVTDSLHLTHRLDAAGFSPDNLSITLRASGSTWRFGDPDPANLGGTTRTLDNVTGQTEIEPGLLSRGGWAVFDDSHTLVFNGEDWLEPRQTQGRLDLYFFGYGHDYQRCLADFCAVAGPTPLLPRWVLGNWWSRYWAYTQDELLGLMGDFQAHGIPLSVCIVDMDWHITKTGNSSNGWTGYTWNKALFPDPESFIAALHDLGLKTALNLHPASGIHPHEAQYPAMARHMGLDPARKQPVPFDIANPHFTQGYFELLHHPLEAQGIDFWWMDWQQGTASTVAGLDPLWWLNHLHFLDLGRDGRKRPFIFSRWGKLGNHRYPIGFSGDTTVTWDSLAFQPYFTSTASNVGYGWWSHDIGGHMLGTEDGELYTRWVQFGLFSPILRLHSTNNPYNDRRPWGFDPTVETITTDAMRLRHALIPYLYSMSWRNAQKHVSLCNPLYHTSPEREEAYRCPDQYLFGSELLAAPFVQPADQDTCLSRQAVWLPEGGWYDFFSGEYYPGDAWYAIYGRLQDIPVFARAGAIVPLGPRVRWGGVENPAELTLHVFAGQDNRFDLYEDDGETTAYRQGAWAITPIAQVWQPAVLKLTVGPAEGDRGVLPARRAYRPIFHGVANPASIQASLNGQPVDLAATYDPQAESLTLAPVEMAPADKLEITLKAKGKSLLSRRDRKAEKCVAMLRSFKAPSSVKHAIETHMSAIVGDIRALLPYQSSLRDSQLQALIETLTGTGIHTIDHIGKPEYIILWNNQARPDFRYRISVSNGDSWFHQFQAEHGVVPSFKVIDQAEIQVKPWSLTLDFCDVLTMRVDR